MIEMQYGGTALLLLVNPRIPPQTMPHLFIVWKEDAPIMQQYESTTV